MSEHSLPLQQAYIAWGESCLTVHIYILEDDINWKDGNNKLVASQHISTLIIIITTYSKHYLFSMHVRTL